MLNITIKSKKIYITQDTYKIIQDIINNKNNLCMRDMYLELKNKYGINNEMLAYKLINGVRRGQKNLIII